MKVSRFVMLCLFGLSTGCPNPRDPWPCPTVSLRPRTPVSGTVLWSVGEDSGNLTYPSGTPGAYEEGGAVAGGLGNTVRVDPDTQSFVLDDWIVMDPRTDATRLRADFHLGDPRDWEVGSHPIERLYQDRRRPETFWEVRLYFDDTACKSCRSCEAFVNGVAFEVLEAGGSLTPYPEVVSEDFRRRYRVRLDVHDLVGHRYEDGGPVECASRASLVFDLTFERTSSDFLIEPDRFCNQYSTL